MDQEYTTALMAETLREGLSRLRGRPVAVRELRRDYFSRSSSFWAEWLHVLLDGGERLGWFSKDLGPRRLVNGASAVRAGALGPSRRELSVYQQVLAGRGFGTPELYAWRWDPPGGACWLFLEAVGGSRLAWDPDFDRWVAAARWAAGFHDATPRRPRERTHCPPRARRAPHRGCAA